MIGKENQGLADQAVRPGASQTPLVRQPPIVTRRAGSIQSSIPKWGFSSAVTTAAALWSLVQRFWLILSSSPGSNVSNRSKFPGQFRVQFQPGTELLQQVSTYNPLVKSQHFLLQWSIWVLIVSQHDEYVDCAVSVALSPPAFRFAIRQVFVESRSKTHQFGLN